MFGQPVFASTQRKPGSLIAGQTAQWTTHLASLTCRRFFGTLLEPCNQTQVLRSLGITGDVHQLRKVFADWPSSVTEDNPIQPGDKLVLPQGSYAVKGVKAYPGQQLEIFIEVPAS